MDRVSIVSRNGHNLPYRRFLDQAEAERFLLKAACNVENLLHFRVVWRETGLGRGAGPQSDRMVLRGLATQIATGQLRVLEAARQVFTGRHGDAGSGAPRGGGASRTYRPAEPAPPIPDRKPEGPKPLKIRAYVPPVPVAPRPSIDVARQVAALKQAARRGTPFCEQCNKAKKQEHEPVTKAR